MYYNLFIISIIFFWIFSFVVSLSILIIFFDRYIKKQNSNIDSALNNIITSLGVLSAIVFFSFNSIISIAKDKVLYYANIVIKIYMSFTFSFIIIYLIHNFIKIINIIIKYKGNSLKKVIVEFQYSSSGDNLFSIFEWLLVFIFSLFLSLIFFKFDIFSISFHN